MTNAIGIAQDFLKLHTALSAADIAAQLSHLSVSRLTELTDDNIADLLSVASKLALSSEEPHHELAFDIAVRLASLYSAHYDGILAASDLILARLGNFPSRKLLHNRFNWDNNRTFASSPLAFLEVSTREAENSVASSETESVVLTDFQIDFLSVLATKKAVSISAPTSAGKSYTLSLHLAHVFKAKPNAVVVYIVPTRALIRQVQYDIAVIFKAFNLANIRVSAVPQVASHTEKENGNVYVLTQERLSTFMGLPDNDTTIDVLILDEAQEVSDKGRGIILQAAVERALSNNSLAHVVFASPLTKNPDKLLKLFNQDYGVHFSASVGPVAQNLISVVPIHGKPLQIRVELLKGETAIPVAEVALSEPFRGSSQLALAAIKLTQPGDSSLIYSSGPRDAEKIAEFIASKLPLPTAYCEEVEEVCSFLTEHIHPEYSLIELIRKGVGFHYGKIPDIVRAKLEELFKARRIKFLSCTSTLLQGVNLPARNIFLKNPKKGRGKPISSSDFWNLAGRAGRLLHEFHGNVWCVSLSTWDSNPLQGSRFHNISPAFEEVLNNCTHELLLYMTDAAKTEAMPYLEHAFAKIFCDFTLQEKNLSQSIYATSFNVNELKMLDEAAILFQYTCRCEKAVFLENPTICPRKVESLAAYLADAADLGIYTPMYPYQPGSTYNLKHIFELLERAVIRNGNNSYVYFTWLAHQWMTGATLRELIQNKIRRDKANRREVSVNETVRSILEDLENVIRFTYVKYLKLYNDLFIREAKKRSLNVSDQVVPLHLYLEFGASDTAVIHLISLGLSRTTAVLSRRILPISKDATREDCIAIIKSTNLHAIDLPQICRQEVVRLAKVL